MAHPAIRSISARLLLAVVAITLSLTTSSRATAQGDPYYDALLAMKAKTGKDNALIHYADASRVMPAIPSPSQKQLIQEVLDKGWTPAAEPLAGYLTQCQQAFSHIWKGARLDHAEGLGTGMGLHTPVPNFLATQNAAKMLAVEGNRSLAGGDAGRAMDCYITALIFGRDFAAEGNLLVSASISISCQSAVQPSIHRLIRSGSLNQAQLDRLALVLAHIEKTNAGVIAACRTDRQMTQATFQRIKDAAASPSPTKDDEAMVLDFARQNGLQRNQVPGRIDQLNQEIAPLFNGIEAWLAQPSQNRTPESWQRIEASWANASPLAKNCMPSYLDPITRQDVMLAKLRILRLEVALARHRQDKGSHPDTLARLAPVYTPEPILDPFSGQAFRYRPLSNGADYALFSIGPDRAENPDHSLYDPAKGVTSPGEVYFR